MGIKSLISVIIVILCINNNALAGEQLTQINCADIVPCKQPNVTSVIKKTNVEPRPNGTIINNIYIKNDTPKTHNSNCSLYEGHEAKATQTVEGKSLNTGFDWASLVAKLASTLSWPFIALIGIYIFRNQLKMLLPKLSKFRFKELELLFGKELKEVKEGVESGQLPNLDELPEKSLIRQKRDILFELARKHPRQAIIEAWIMLETSMKLALLNMNPKDVIAVMPFQNSTLELFKDNYTFRSYINSLYELRNTLINSPELEIDHPKATSFIELAFRLILYIHNRWVQPQV